MQYAQGLRVLQSAEGVKRESYRVLQLRMRQHTGKRQVVGG